MKKTILLMGILIFLIMDGVYSHPIGRLGSPELFNKSLALNYVNIYYSSYTNHLIYQENSTYITDSYITDRIPEYTTIYTIENKTYWLLYQIYLTTEKEQTTIDFYKNFKHPKYKFYENQEVMNIFFLRNRFVGGSCLGYYDCGYNFGKVTYHEKAIAGTHWY